MADESGYFKSFNFFHPQSQHSPQALGQALMTPLSDLQVSSPAPQQAPTMPSLTDMKTAGNVPIMKGFSHAPGRPEGVPANATSWQGSLPWLKSSTPWRGGN